jgi:hypothetical protein
VLPQALGKAPCGSAVDEDPPRALNRNLPLVVSPKLQKAPRSTDMEERMKDPCIEGVSVANYATPPTQRFPILNGGSGNQWTADDAVSMTLHK